MRPATLANSFVDYGLMVDDVAMMMWAMFPSFRA